MKSGLSVQNLKIKFPEYEISCDDFSVNPGEFFEVDAPSGFGKTTLMRALMGFQKITSGTVSLNGQAIQSEPAHLRNLGVVFQDHLLFPNLDAFENAVFGLKLRKQLSDGAILRAKEAFAAVGLESRMHAPITELSGGERQRVALLRATLFEPECLLLDEPLKGLDARSTDQVLEYLKNLVRTREIPVVWVSHQGRDLFPGGSIIGSERPGFRHFTVNRKKS